MGGRGGEEEHGGRRSRKMLLPPPTASARAATLLLRHEAEGGALTMLTTPPPLQQVGVSSLARHPGGTWTLGFSQQGGRERSRGPVGGTAAAGSGSCWYLLRLASLATFWKTRNRRRDNGGTAACRLLLCLEDVSTFSCLWGRQTWWNLNVVTFARFLGEGSVCHCCHDDGEQLTLKVISLSRLPRNVLTVSKPKPEPSQAM